MACELCEAKKSLKDVKFIGKNIFVLICKSCHVPLAISTSHRAIFTNEEKQEVIFAFYKALRLKGNIDWKNRQIFNHAHAHLR